jgi:hypothetical protein
VFAECHGCAWDSTQPTARADAGKHHEDTGHRVIVSRVVQVLDGTVS